MIDEIGFIGGGAFTEHYRVFSDLGLDGGIYCSLSSAEKAAKTISGANGWAIILKTVEGMEAKKGIVSPLRMEQWL